MASSTTNYGLTKPDQTELYDIAVQNANMDTIDSQMKANDDALYYKSGDTITLQTGCFAGFLDNTKKQIHFAIPLNKALSSNISGVSIPDNFTCYHPEGVLFDNVPLASIATVNIYRTGRSYLDVRLVFSTAFSQTGNRPVVVKAGGSTNTLTFT